MPKFLGPRKFNWKQRWRTKPLCVFLTKTFHKVQSSTMDNEVGKNLPARILYLKKGKKTRTLFMFLAAVMLTRQSTHRYERLVASFITGINCFTSLSFGRETSSHLEIYGRKPLAYMLRLKFGPFKCLRYLFYLNRAVFSAPVPCWDYPAQGPSTGKTFGSAPDEIWCGPVVSGCLHCKFYPSRTLFFFLDPCHFYRSRAKNFLSSKPGLNVISHSWSHGTIGNDDFWHNTTL